MWEGARCRSGATADSDMLAGRRWPAHHMGPRSSPEGRSKSRQNLGIYRQQVIAPNKVIMRWLAHRGGALDFRDHCADAPRPAVSGRGRARRRSGNHTRGSDAGAGHAVRISVRRPAARRADRDRQMRRLRTCKCRRMREIVLEGAIHPDETAIEGPFGDHTGYYNEQETLSGVHHRSDHHAPRSDLSLHLHRQTAR